MSTSTHHQQSLIPDTLILAVAFVIAVTVMWPAFILALLTRFCIQRTRYPFPLWLLATALGVGGTAYMVLYTDVEALTITALASLLEPLLHLQTPDVTRILPHFWPVWLHSLSVFPLVAGCIELFRSRNLKSFLLAQEREHQITRERRSRRATRLVKKAPLQLNGKAVLGVLIENPLHIKR